MLYTEFLTKVHDDDKKALTGDRQRLKNEWTILLVTRYIQGSAKIVIIDENDNTQQQGIVVIDPRTPKSHERTAVYDPRPRFFIFLS